MRKATGRCRGVIHSVLLPGRMALLEAEVLMAGDLAEVGLEVEASVEGGGRLTR